MQDKMTGYTYIPQAKPRYDLGLAKFPLVTNIHFDVLEITRFLTSLIRARKTEGNEDCQGIDM